MKTHFKTALLTLAVLAFWTCSETPDDTNVSTPMMSLNADLTIPAEGIENGIIEVKVENAVDPLITAEVDGVVITDARYEDNCVIFAASGNYSLETRKGWAEVSCLDVKQKLEFSQGAYMEFGELPAIPAEGMTNGELTVTVHNFLNLEVKAEVDGVVFTDAEWADNCVTFAVAENTTSEVRTGWLEVSCGELVKRFEAVQTVHFIHKYTGWAELPSANNSGNYIYYAHDKLPSDPSKRNYSFCYAPEHCAALWVAYPLHDCYIGDAERSSTNAFGYDYDFISYTQMLGFGGEELQANIGKNAFYPQGGGSYSHSRGHQLPSADRTVSSEDNRTTFYATNMTPQLQGLNGGAWEKLEDLARQWMCADTLYVVTGAIYDEGHGYAYDEKGNGKAVSVPTHYYKALLRTKDGNTGKPVYECSADELKCIGFILKHDGSRTGQNIYSTDACSVADLESRTGFTFFINVPEAPKSDYDLSLWSGITQQ